MTDEFSIRGWWYRLKFIAFTTKEHSFPCIVVDYIFDEIIAVIGRTQRSYTYATVFITLDFYFLVD